jgi:hypothetical protein
MLRTIANPRAGDIVLFEPKTLFGKAVERIQNIFKSDEIQESKTHAAMVTDPGLFQPKQNETNLRVTDIEFGRRASSYFVRQEHAYFKIYRLYNSQQSYYSELGGRTADSQVLAERAAAIALELEGARYSLLNCYRALMIHRNQLEHTITPALLEQIQNFNTSHTYMCVSFVLICYQKACLELLGGLPLAFKLNPFCAPSYLAHHFAKPDGHFTQLPPDVIAEIYHSGAPVFRPSASTQRLSLRHFSRHAWEYTPLVEGQEQEEEQEAQKEGLGPT